MPECPYPFAPRSSARNTTPATDRHVARIFIGRESARPPMLTAEERILLHLLAYVRRGKRFEVPFEMTQQGIALAVSVRRSHVSAVLAEMEKHGLLTKRMAHVEAGGDGVPDLDASRARAPPTTAAPRRFYGRSRELAAAREFLRSPATCLTVRGLPGVGKTAFLARLAGGRGGRRRGGGP